MLLSFLIINYMKNFKSILAIVVLAAISYSCNNSAVQKMMQEPETGIIVSDENKAKFEDQINTFRTFTKAFHDEDINQLMSVVADSIQWSPPEYNGGETVGYDGFKAVVSAYFENFDDITFNEAEGLIGSDNAYWSGSLYSTGEINTDPNVMRVYGTWVCQHTETGATVYNKWYAVLGFNDDGKIATFSDWFDVTGMQTQIEKFVESNLD